MHKSNLNSAGLEFYFARLSQFIILDTLHLNLQIVANNMLASVLPFTPELADRVSEYCEQHSEGTF
jgi:hypothetical protein